MSIKLYPPSIEGVIPAFYGTVLTVPFSMNKAVSKNNVSGMQLKIKTIQSGAYVLTGSTKDIDYESKQAIFNLAALENEAISKLKIGQHYKLQIAYIANDEEKTIGYFSDVATIKYTSEPIVQIQGLEKNLINIHQYNYIGIYLNENDLSEKIYSYCFNLYDKNNKLIQTSEEKIHNSAIDSIEQYDSYEINQDLTTNQTYYIEYIVTTTNGLQKSSGKYRIMQKQSINPEIKADLITTLNEENGYVDISLEGKRNADGVEYASTGAFKILRSSEEDGYSTWDEILRFALYGQQPSKWNWKDYIVKQGVTYRYALQQYNDAGLSSNKLDSNPIYVDFEHAFLYDGERQLKIKYNPKITNFKNNLLENKINTIGGQYPFIFKNGNVKYKEFAISGLISYQMDEDFLFTSKDKIGDYTVNLTSENIATERAFKLEVLEWLNNGEPKLFKSPTEGNYIVRLMNVSLSPNDTVGRMLHSFTATAYEIAEYTYNNLSALGLVSVGDPSVKQLRWETVEIDKMKAEKIYDNLIDYKAVALRFEGMMPGDKLYIDDGILRPDMEGTGFYITIGVTGSYIIDLNSNITIKKVNFSDGQNNGRMIQHQGTLTYAYYSKTQNRFDSISNVQIIDVPAEQYIGEYDIINNIIDIKTQIQEFYAVHAMLRNIQRLYCKSDIYYTTKECTTEFVNFDPYILYEVYQDNTLSYYLDGSNKVKYSIDDYSSKIYINGVEIDLVEKLEYVIKLPKINTLSIGSGIIAEVSYQKQVLEYSVENDQNNYPYLYNLNQEQKYAYETLYQAIYVEELSDVENLRSEYLKAYKLFIIELERVLKEKEASQGDVAI